MVGYGPDPCECVHIAKSVGFKHIVQGNHDYVILNKECDSLFNSVARAAAEYTRDKLSADERKWLSELPLKAEVENFLIALVSGDIRWLVKH